MPNPENLKPFEKGHPKSPNAGKKKGYKAINTYVREILQKQPIREIIKNFDKLGIPFKNNAELLAWKKILLAIHKNPHASLAAIKDIEERQDGKTPDKIEGNINVNLKSLSLKQLKELERSL